MIEKIAWPFLPLSEQLLFVKIANKQLNIIKYFHKQKATKIERCQDLWPNHEYLKSTGVHQFYL